MAENVKDQLVQQLLEARKQHTENLSAIMASFTENARQSLATFIKENPQYLYGEDISFSIYVQTVDFREKRVTTTASCSAKDNQEKKIFGIFEGALEDNPDKMISGSTARALIPFVSKLRSEGFVPFVCEETLVATFCIPGVDEESDC